MPRRKISKKDRGDNQILEKSMTEDAWWTVNDLIEYLNISRATIWRWVNDEDARPDGFPLPAQFTTRVYRWKTEDVIAWAESLAA